MSKMLLEEIKEGGSVGGGTPNQPKGEPPAPKIDPGSKEEGDKFDDFGYEKEPEIEGDKNPKGEPGAKKEDPKLQEPAKVENPITGYSEDVKVEDPPAAPTEKKEEIKLSFELKTEGLPEDEVQRIKEFAKETEAPEKVMQKYVDMRKSELDKQKKANEEAERNQKAEVSRLRASWQNELKQDPVFGGEKYAFNVVQAEKVVEQMMPNTKKMLTERKSMLPPYVMKDLAKIAEHLFATEKLVQGDAIVPKQKEEEENDPLAYYGQ